MARLGDGVDLVGVGESHGEVAGHAGTLAGATHAALTSC